MIGTLKSNSAITVEDPRIAYLNSLTDSGAYAKFSTVYLQIGSSTFSYSGTTLLKYRFKHLAKADVQATWKDFSLGFSMRYNSVMSNIDAAFEDGLSYKGYPIIVDGKQVEILPGLKKYRQEHNQGSLVFDARIGYEFKEHYRLGFMINNVLNAEYSSRPGDIQPPRTYMIQIQMKF